MATIKTGLISSDEAFGKSGVEFWNTIKEIGWKQTPFLTAIGTAAPSNRSANVASGHTWFYDEAPEGDADNAYAEGSAPAPLKYIVGGELKNHYQIVKDTYGVSGTEDAGTRVDGSAQLVRSGEATMIRHKQTLEKILLGDQAAVGRVNGGSGTIGKCGGLKSFATATNTIDATNTKSLDMQMLRDVLKIGFLKARPYDFILVADTMMDRIMDLLDKIKQANNTVKYLHDKVVAINSQYGDNVKLLLSPNLGKQELIAFRSDDIYRVDWRATQKRDLKTENDEVKREILTEFTLRVCTPVAFAWVKNIKL